LIRSDFIIMLNKFIIIKMIDNKDFKFIINDYYFDEITIIFVS